MVYFTCNHCGESLKKNKVGPHYQIKCRNRIAVSCMDCNKDFDELTYDNHTKCISEKEKYSALNSQPDPSANKGEMKRIEMMKQVEMVMARTDLTREQSLLGSALLKCDCLPRKLKKFQNYLTNGMPGTRMEVILQFWDLLQEESKTNGKKQNGMACKVENNELKENKDQEITALDVNALTKRQKKQLKMEAKQNETELQEVKNDPSGENVQGEDEVKRKKKSKKGGSNENKLEDSNLEEGESKKKGKKRKGEEIVQSVCEAKINKENGNTKDLPVNGSSIGKSSKFNWRDTIVKLLESKSDKELSLKRLQKKVMAEYESLHGQPFEKHFAKFNKTVSKTPGLVVEKGVAKLIAAP